MKKLKSASKLLKNSDTWTPKTVTSPFDFEYMQLNWNDFVPSFYPN